VNFPNIPLPHSNASGYTDGPIQNSRSNSLYQSLIFCLLWDFL